MIKASEALGKMANPNTASFYEQTGCANTAQDALGSVNPVLGQDRLRDSESFRKHSPLILLLVKKLSTTFSPLLFTM